MSWAPQTLPGLIPTWLCESCNVMTEKSCPITQNTRAAIFRAVSNIVPGHALNVTPESLTPIFQALEDNCPINRQQGERDVA